MIKIYICDYFTTAFWPEVDLIFSEHLWSEFKLKASGQQQAHKQVSKEEFKTYMHLKNNADATAKQLNIHSTYTHSYGIKIQHRIWVLISKHVSMNYR